jgi:hypothetical protein
VSSARSQSGIVGVGTVIFVAVLGLLAYLLLAAFEGDVDKFGRVPVPSTGASVELPEGGSDVYYAEAGGDADTPLTLPDGLEFSLVGPDGQGVDVDQRGGDPKGIEGGRARVVGIAFAPAEGLYRVTVETDAATARPRPELTFGQSPFQAVEARFDEIVEELKGTTGIVVAVVLVLLFFAPRVQRALRS